MTVSVIIPTYNGAEKLYRILRALEVQTIRSFETVVVIDGSTDNTKEILSKPWDLTIRVIEQKNKGRAAVRNTGVRNSSGELLIFFDDDMLPEKNCIGQHLVHHQHFPESILTGAQVENYKLSKTDFQKYRYHLTKKWSKDISKYYNTPLPRENPFITAANFSLSRKLFVRLGGFDERLKDAEDFDLAIRAIKLNIHLFYNEEAFAWHYDPVTCQKYVHRLKEYHKAQYKLTELKPELGVLAYKYFAVPPKGLKKMVFKFFRGRFWIESIDKNTWLLLLPKALRYRIYDFIITANGVYFNSY